MFVPYLYAVWAVNKKVSDTGLWDVYEVAGGAPGEYIVTNVRYRDYALTIEAFTYTENRRKILTRHTSTSYNVDVSSISMMDDRFITVLKMAPWRKPAFILGNLQYPGRSLYVDDLETLFGETKRQVLLSDNGTIPGPENYWFFDPPLQNLTVAPQTGPLAPLVPTVQPAQLTPFDG